MPFETHSLVCSSIEHGMGGSPGKPTEFQCFTNVFNIFVDTQPVHNDFPISHSFWAVIVSVMRYVMIMNDGLMIMTRGVIKKFILLHFPLADVFETNCHFSVPWKTESEPVPHR